MKFNKDMKTNDLPIPSFSLGEIALFQLLFYAAFWIMNDYAATLITIIFPTIFAFLLVIAFIAEMMSKTKNIGWYFKLMILSIIIPIITAFIFIKALNVNFDWSVL